MNHHRTWNRIALPCLALLLCAAPLARPSSASPAGHQVVLGDVTIEQNADGSVTVIHASDGSVIEYASFDILAGELVQFIQPGADARVLNRVSGDATYIDGTLLANGIVYIINPAGVFMNGSAVVDVGGLVAAAGHLSNEDFAAGVDRFDLTGPVENWSENVRGELVALLGTRVANHGRIEAADGVIALVAGERTVLYQLGGRVHVEVDGPAAGAAPQTGVLQAGHALTGGGQVIFAVGDHYSLAINHSGVTSGSDVLLHGGDDGTLLVQGEIDARGDGDGEQGGSIHVLGERIALVGATLDASGDSGGGEIRVGGDLRGEGSLRTASRTYIDADSVLRADASQAGDGGSVVVWGDEAAVMAGSISARGGAAGGDGGFAEVSSLGLLDPSGTVDLRADAGSAGTFLIDPQDIVIVGGSADGSDDPDGSSSQVASDDGTLGEILFGDLGDASVPFEIYESEIEGTNANLVLEARNSVSVSGSFDHQVEGEGNGVVVVMDNNDLTIRTRNDTDDELGSAMTPGIDLGTLAWRTGGDGSISFATGDDGSGGGGTGAAAGISVGDLSTEGGSLRLSTRNGAITAGNLDSSGLDGASGGNAGLINVFASAGDVTVGDVAARGGDGASGAGGSGGAITLATNDGVMTAGDVDASGGDGSSNGGAAGFNIQLQAGDEDVSGGSALVVGDVTSRGGEGLSGNGGAGGRVTALSVEEPAADPDDPPLGGGPVTLGDVDTSGGDGSASGGNGGAIGASARGVGDLTLGNLTSAGGDANSDGVLVGPEAGGSGGRIDLRVSDGDLLAGSIVSSGGDGSNDVVDTLDGARGRAGTVDLGTGTDGDILLSGPIHAVDGDGSGTPVADAAVILLAAGDVEFAPGLDPDIRTTENVLLEGVSVGATESVEIDAVGVTSALRNGSRVLRLGAEVTAAVDVTTAGFDTFQVLLGSAEADVDVTQAAVDGLGSGIEISVAGAPGTSTLTSAQMMDPDIEGGVNLEVQLDDGLADLDDVALELVVAPDALHGSGNVLLLGEDDIVLATAAGNPAISMLPPAVQPDAGTGNVTLRADGDADGSGAIRATGGQLAIDMNTGSEPTGRLLLVAAQGVGAPGTPIETANVDVLLGGTVESGGFHLRNSAGGDVTLSVVFLPLDADPELDPVLPTIDPGFDADDAIAVVAGTGDVEIVNEAGNIVLAGNVRAGRVTSGGDVLLDAPVLVTRNSEVVAGGDVTFSETVDSDISTLTTRNLAVQAGGSVRFGGDVGAGFELRNLDVTGDVELAQDTSFTTLQSASFGGDVNAVSDDAASMTVTSGTEVEFGGNLGETGRLAGLQVDGSSIVFSGSTDQAVVTGAGGIALNTGAALPTPPTLATIGKLGGDLRLESAGGDVLVGAPGANQKLSVDGLVELVGDTVRVGDVSAHAISVDAQSAFEVVARAPGEVALPDGGLVPDEGAELIADTISTTLAPTPIGSGLAPRFVTASGVVDGAGAGGLEVLSLHRPVSSADLVDTSNPAAPRFFDLAVAVPDPGNEVEPDPRPLDPLLPALPGSEDPAGSAAAPGDEAVLAFLRCSESAQGDRETRDCAPAPGSPLDTPRGVEIGERHRRLFGSSADAQAARRLLAGNSAEASAARRDLVALLAQLRLLGMDAQAYERVRDQLLGAAAGAGGRDALLAQLRAEARGFPI